MADMSGARTSGWTTLTPSVPSEVILSVQQDIPPKSIASCAHFTPHPWRGLVLGEVHARPFHAITTPRRVLHFAFLTTSEQATADVAALASYCAERGVQGPTEGTKHHRVAFADAVLRWEQHSEFTTYTWEISTRNDEPFEPPASGLVHTMRGLPQPGPHIVSVDLHLIAQESVINLDDVYDSGSLAASSVEGGQATLATDFRVGADGFVRLLVLNRGLSSARAGALVQRLLELETYRTLALLGLPEAARLAPSVRQAEESLTGITRAMTQAEDLSANRHLLDELTALAAGIEAETAASSYRFGASRAYDGIVQQRLAAIREQPFQDYPTLSAFLLRRMAPAMRTCQTLEDRQAALSHRVAHAANLLRTRVDVEIEQQNRDLLQSMNERTRLQLRLQQTVEGLSIAAISYYVIGLLNYLFKGAKDMGVAFDPEIATALAIPVTLMCVSLVVRRIRKHHGADKI